MKLSPDVLAVLRSASVNGCHLTMPQLADRKLYERVNKALVCLGGVWTRKVQAHVFPSDPRALIEAAVTDEQVVDPKQEFQFFPTPPALARKMVNLLDAKPHHRILEPSAGRGDLLAPLLQDGIPPKQIRVCELMPANRQHLLDQGWTVLAEDFLTLPRDKHKFDRILMNPPFKNNQDLEHFNHAWMMLKPGGTLVALTSPHWTFATEQRVVNFRENLERLGACHETIPEGTFADTSIRTELIVLHRENIRYNAHAFSLEMTSRKIVQGNPAAPAVQTPAPRKANLATLSTEAWASL